MARSFTVPAFLRDPLLERDYLRLCSRPAFFRNRAIGAALLGAVLLLMYGLRDPTGSPDEVGRSIHLVFTWLAALLTSATAAAEAAVAIPTERSTGSLPVLLTVPRSPLRLATGFFLSRVLVALTALLAVLPLEGTALLLGGVDLSAMAEALLCILSATVFGAALGLFAGYDAPNHRLAVGRTGLMSLAITVLLPMALGTAAGILHDYKAVPASPTTDPLHPYRPEDWCALAGLVTFFVTPLGGLVTHTAMMFRYGMPPVLPGWLTPSRIHLLVALLSFAGAVAAIVVTGRRLRADTERSTVAAHRTGPWKWFLSLFGRRGARDPVDVWPAALFWKESRPPRNPWVRWSLHVAVLGYAVLLGWFWLSPEVQRSLTGPRHQELPVFDCFCTLPLWLFFLGTSAACGTLLAEERERQSLDLLRAAPFFPRDYFLARFLGIGWRLLPLALATIPFVLLGTWMGIVHPAGVLAFGIGMALVAPFLALLSFRMGMGATTVRAAQRRIGMTLGVFIAGWPLLHWFLAESLSKMERTSMATLQEVVLSLNPFVATTGPYLLFCRAAFVKDEDLLRMGIAGTVAALFWGLCAGVLWWRLPGDLDRALHRAEDG